MEGEPKRQARLGRRFESFPLDLGTTSDFPRSSRAPCTTRPPPKRVVILSKMPSRDHVQGSGRTPLRVYGPQPTYQTYKSPFGPKTKHSPNLMGLNARNAMSIGSIAAGFGISAGIFALFFFGEVPRVRNDILTKMPIIGDYFVREVPPEDNPF